jgi:hypothetical protein
VAAIHIIKNDPALPDILPVERDSDVYWSGNWILTKEAVHALIGGRVYFHEKQSSPSFFGGTILHAQQIPEGDEYAGRFILTFRFEPACKGVTTSLDGWAQEMKLLL